MLNRIEHGTRALTCKFSIPDIASVEHPAGRRRNRYHDVHREPPRVEVEHHVGKQPEVVGGDGLALVRMTGWKVKRQVAVNRFPDLEHAALEGLGFVA